ncbi:collagen alpha-1(I) chain-like [Megalops cyprinoides]|uniref:collagen alpha-1(I) chain-like n=1 Tax=Megalops cyprinoides TaxID=118141 RepID=UPI001864CF45|nr:collagen alpha-1(I) chain-like [Megalops cyprinoides]
MASMQDGVNFTAPPYGKVLVLGAIAAASAFVVTILIVLLCVGCQRKGKTHNAQTEGTKHRLMDMSILRQSKLRSISKSDTKLHEMNRLNCNGKKASKNRPASMDLLLLPSRRSNSDLRCPQSRQLPQIPTTPGEERDHTYSEVGGRGSPPRCPDDALYEIVGGRAGETDTPAPPAPANTPAPPSPPPGDNKIGGNGLPGGNGALVLEPGVPPQDAVTAEYACIRKVRKVDKPQRRENGTETSEQDPALAPPPAHPLSQKVPRKHVEPFQLHSFPKEAVFMGNGEQYIWKPPEDDDMVMLPPKHMGPHNPQQGDNTQSQPASAGVSEMYSKVCKPGKKKRPMPGSPPANRENNGHRTLARGGEREGGMAGFSVVVKPQSWAGGAQQEGRAGGPPVPADDHCYESIGEKAWPPGTGEPNPEHDALKMDWKRERPINATLKPKKKKEKPLLQQQQKSLSNKTLAGDNLYESIGDLKHGVTSSSTTTIFTFNDGMEMYVTGL